MARLEAAIFDLDGVLVDTARFHYLGWRRLADELDVPFDEQKNERLKGVDRMGSLLRLLPQNHGYSRAQLDEFCERKNRYYVEMIAGITPADLFEGAEALLADLHHAGVRRAIASASKNAKAVVERLRIGRWFDAIVDGYDFTRTKPDPEVFLVAAEQVGAAPGDCVVLEDAEAGVEAALRAGMAVVGMGDPRSLARAQLVIGSLTELSAARLRGLIGG